MPEQFDIAAFHPKRQGIRKVLGDLEAEIMELVWARPTGQGTTVREIFETLYARRRIAYTTVMSTMARLAKKRLLRAETADQAYVYYPTVTQDEFVARFVGDILEDLVVNFSGVALDRLQWPRDPATAARVRHLLDEIARRRATERSPEGSEAAGTGAEGCGTAGATDGGEAE